MTPLHVAAHKGDRISIVEHLLHKKADVNIEDNNGVSKTTIIMSQRSKKECYYLYSTSIYKLKQVLPR